MRFWHERMKTSARNGAGDMPASSVAKQGPNLPAAGSRDISWMLPSKPAVPGTARRERGP